MTYQTDKFTGANGTTATIQAKYNCIKVCAVKVNVWKSGMKKKKMGTVW